MLFGTFDPELSRNRVIERTLTVSGLGVILCHRSIWHGERWRLSTWAAFLVALKAIRVYVVLTWRFATLPRPDVVLVLYPGFVDMLVIGPLARLRRTPVVFDMFISLEETIVGDRRLASSRSLRAGLARAFDRWSCRLASMVLADTPENAKFIAAVTGIPPDRVRVLWVGALESVFRPADREAIDRHVVLFYGTFIPLHGVLTIVRAAKLLEEDDVRIRLVGTGQQRDDARKLASELGARNLAFIDRIPFEELGSEIARATICLGIFGDSEKAARVVPHKVYECLAVGRPIVTADTPAVRNALGDAVAKVAPGDAGALALKVRELLADDRRREALAKRGRSRFVASYSERRLGELLEAHVTEATVRRRAKTT